MANITGTAGNDTVTPFVVTLGVVGGVATALADNIQGLGGNDSLDGGGGADDLFGGDGNDTIFGGVGAELLGGFNDLLDGGAGDDSLVAGDGPDSLRGGDGRDFLFGGNGNDTADGGNGADDIFGEAGDDSLFGGTGAELLGSFNDSINGGAGNDTIDGGDGPDRLVGDIGNDSIVGGNENDTLDGGADLDTLIGGAGDDSVLGGLGNDSVIGGNGNDIIDGGDGTDVVDYAALGAAVTLRSQGVINKGVLGTDTIATIERIVGAAGFANLIDGQIVGPQTTSFNIDLLFNRLTINGIPGLGSVTFTVENFVNVRGTANDDTVFGGNADNVFFGTLGDDQYFGEGGFDTIDYSGLGGAVTLRSQGVIDKGVLGTDTIETMERIVGGAGFANFIDGQIAGPQTTSFVVDLAAETLTVNGIPFLGSANFQVVNFRDVRGTLNNDLIRGNAADNTFFGTRGSDIYDGLGGSDTIDYSGLGSAVTLLSQGVITKGAFGTDTIANMERIVGAAGFANFIDGQVVGPQTTSFVVDLTAQTLVVNGIPFLGSANFQVVNFRDVRGTLNNDLIRGNAADNTFFGTRGSDTYDGAGGVDTIDYSGLGGAVTLLSQGVITKGALGTDTIANMERIVGGAGLANFIDGQVVGPQTTSFVVDLAAEKLTVNGIPFLGSASFQVVNFRDVRGTLNDDVVRGTAAGNIFFGTRGNDSYDGAGGADTIDYSGLGGAITLLSQGVITKGALGTDTIANMERIVGAAGFLNTIDGTIAAPATQTTSFVVNLAANSLTVNGIPGILTASFTVLNFVDVIGTNNADTITGNSGANTLNGAGGNDLLNGGDGDDRLIGGTAGDALNGGAGFDIASYQTATAKITLNLSNLALNTGDAAGDTYGSIERYQGTNFDDRLIGFNGADDLRAEGGNDFVNGGNGSDTLGGGDGNDSILGATGNDSLLGAAGNDTLNGGGGNDTITGSGGADSLIGGGGFDIFVYNARGEGADIITDFNVAQDSFQLSNAGFANVFPLGGLAAGRFAANLTGTATAATAQVLYDTDGGQLYFDIDGTGAAARQLLATLTNLAPLTAADFTVVA